MANPFCDCPLVGYCERYRDTMTARTHQICCGEDIDPDKAMAYRKAWLEEAQPDNPAHVAQVVATLEAAQRAVESQSLPEAWRKAMSKPAPCKYLGDAIGETVACARCGKGVKIKVFACARHGRCTLARPGDGIQCCAGCPDFTADPAHGLYLQVGPGGMGDALLALTIAEGLRWQNPDRPITFVCGQHVASWARMFWPLVRQPNPLQEPKLMCDDPNPVRFAKDYWSKWQKKFQVKAISPRFIGHDIPEADSYAGHVLIAPFANHHFRDWPVDMWLAVERILMSWDIPCAVVHSRPETRLDRFVGKRLVGRAPMLVASAVRKALAVTGNDSGIPHLAGILGTPGIVVCTPITDFSGIWPTIRSMGGRKQQMPQPEEVANAILMQAEAVRQRENSCTT